MSVMIRIGTAHYPVTEVMARRYPDLGFDRGKRGRRRRWHRGYWWLLEAELKKSIDDVELYLDWGYRKMRVEFVEFEEVFGVD